MKPYIIAFAAVLAALAGCSKPAADPLAQDQMAAAATPAAAAHADVLESCKARSEAEHRAMAERRECRDAWAAEHAIQEADTAQATQKANAWMQAEMDRSRAARADAAKKEKPE